MVPVLQGRRQLRRCAARVCPVQLGEFAEQDVEGPAVHDGVVCEEYEAVEAVVETQQRHAHQGPSERSNRWDTASDIHAAARSSAGAPALV